MPAQSDASIESTGDVRNEVGVWAAFGRLGDERIVSLRGVAELRAHPGERRAVVSHAGPASSDVAVLRRVSPYLATLLGRTALHAASVVLPAGAVLCCADAGTGKSTLARALDRAEFAVLGDDHVVLDVREGARIGAHPSFPFIDVHVGGSNGGSDGEDYPARIGPGGEGKTSVQLFSPRPTKPVPVVAVAFMTRGARDARVAREPIEPTDALARLLRDVVFVADPADEASQVARLDVCLALLKAAPAVRLEIPDGLDRMATTAAEVATLWSGHAT